MEDNRPDDIDKVFEDGLEPLRRRPSRAVWDNIEHELDKDDRKILIVRIRFALLASAALLILVGGGELYFRPAPKNAVVVVTNQNPKAGSWKKKIAVPDERSTNLIPRHPSSPKDIAVKPAKTSLSVKQREFAESSQPKTASDVLPQWQPIASGAQLAYITPAQLPISIRPPGMKKVNSLIALQKIRRWSVAAYYTSELAGYNLSDRDSMAINGREIDKKEKHVLSTTAEILAAYAFPRHWVIQMGFGYSWAKSHASPTTSYAVNNNGEIKFQVNTLSGYGYVPASSSSPARLGDSVMIEHSTTTLHYLNAPFMLSYALRFKRLTVMPGLGFSLNFLTGATLGTKLQSASYSPQEYVVKMYGLKRFNYGVLLKTELGYAIDPHWSVTMVASFKNALTPINLHTVVATYPYNLGIGAGLKYDF